MGVPLWMLDEPTTNLDTAGQTLGHPNARSSRCARRSRRRGGSSRARHQQRGDPASNGARLVSTSQRHRPSSRSPTDTSAAGRAPRAQPRSAARVPPPRRARAAADLLRDRRNAVSARHHAREIPARRRCAWVVVGRRAAGIAARAASFSTATTRTTARSSSSRSPASRSPACCSAKSVGHWLLNGAPLAIMGPLAAWAFGAPTSALPGVFMLAC